MMTDYSTDELANFFGFLDDLRASGVTNMFGASPYLMREFDLSHDESSTVLQLWMRTFSHDKTPQERAVTAKEPQA